MTDTLILIAAAVIGSTIWFGLQTFVWYITLGGRCEYQKLRGLVIGAMIGFPVFVLLVESCRFLFGFSSNVGEVILMPVLTAWVFLLAWGGLRVAAHLRRLHLPPTTRRAERDGEASGSQPIRSETNRTSPTRG